MTKQNDIGRRTADDNNRRAREYVVSILGWIAATIVALNAGGLATAISILKNLDHPFLVSSGFFAGLMMMLCSGLLAIIALIQQVEHQNATAEDNVLPSRSSKRGGLGYATASGVLAILSLIAFISSALFIVVNYRDDYANDIRCFAIQRDMLSSMPLRSDDPDLFQALGCRPQGEGSVYAERDTKDDPDAMLERGARRSELPYRNPYRSDGNGAVLKSYPRRYSGLPKPVSAATSVR